jgi:MFS transporter, SP family, arabinose:H+ symporter
MSTPVYSSDSPNSALSKDTLFNNGYIIRFSIIAALGGMLFGYDTAVISGTIPFIKKYFNLDQSKMGWAVGCILIGCALGAMIAGKMAEIKGRKYILMVCSILFAITGIGAGVSTTLFTFSLFRILGGVAVGIASVISPMYIAETAPASWRGRLVSLYQLAVVTGILLAYIANYALADIGDSNWRWMFASQAFIAIIFWLFLLIAPETPRWLAKNGYPKDALSKIVFL